MAGQPPFYGYPPGPPGPPGPGGPPGPPGSYTYVPTPVYLPAYPPPPPPQPVPYPGGYNSYVTNIYQQPPVMPEPAPEPIQIVDHPPAIDWVPATPVTAQMLTNKALVAGKEAWDGSPLCVIRAHHNGEFVPGKLAIKHRSAYIPHDGKEVPVHNFEVLCTQPGAVQWLPSSYGQVPVGAIAAGNTHNAEPLYVCRVRHMGSITPGKVHPSNGCAYISYGGNEIPFKRYEVLCKVG